VLIIKLSIEAIIKAIPKEQGTPKAPLLVLGGAF